MPALLEYLGNLSEMLHQVLQTHQLNPHSYRHGGSLKASTPKAELSPVPQPVGKQLPVLAGQISQEEMLLDAEPSVLHFYCRYLSWVTCPP